MLPFSCPLHICPSSRADCILSSPLSPPTTPLGAASHVSCRSFKQALRLCLALLYHAVLTNSLAGDSGACLLTEGKFQMNKLHIFSIELLKSIFHDFHLEHSLGSKHSCGWAAGKTLILSVFIERLAGKILRLMEQRVAKRSICLPVNRFGCMRPNYGHL